MPTRIKPMDKFAIAAALQEMGALLELKGGEYFKARAYRNGARAVAELNEDIGKLIRENRLTFVKGIGYAIAKQIEELYADGQSSFLNKLRAELPPGIIELAGVPGLTVKKVGLLHEALDITTVEQLKAAAEAGKIRQLKGFGAKTEQKLLEAIAGHKDRERRIHLHQALRAGERILEYLQTAPGFLQAELAGSLRRSKETVSGLIVVASARTPDKLIEHFLRYPLVVRVEERKPQYCSVLLSEGFPATLFAVKPEEFAVVLLQATGSAVHLKKLEQVAAKQKLALTHRGIENLRRGAAGNKGRAQIIRVKSEWEAYDRFGMQYVPPELREDEGEVEAALAGRLPEALITTDDIRGMVHCHTTYSDGKHSLEQMVHAAESMGMKYITITDHSPTAFYAGGVKIDRLQR
ncbi:MAG: helix-hairpin-helix domain-containing protein, partial [Acidobacteriota bacterium]